MKSDEQALPGRWRLARDLTRYPRWLTEVASAFTLARVAALRWTASTALD